MGNHPAGSGGGTVSDIAVKIIENNFPSIQAAMAQNANRAVRETIFDIEGRAKISMQGSKSGAYYERPNRKAHQASAPGEAPAIDTGNLVNSIQSKMVGALSGVVYTNAEYGPVLEMGGAKMAARPFFTPATEAAWPAFLGKMKGIVE